MMNVPETGQNGFTLVEILISLAIAGVLIFAISGVITTALKAEQATRTQNDTLQQARFAMQRMTNAVNKSRRLLLPLGENSTTAWSESVRNVLAVTLDPTLDRDKDGWADANNDRDYLDVNHNGSRDAGEPERIDEDTHSDRDNDGVPGIIGIDDDNDGAADETSNPPDDDEDNSNNEDRANGLDDDGDGNIDEDTSSDMSGDGKAGVAGADDDFDGAVDEAENDDDDEDGQVGEDWIDNQVFFLNGATLMERLPDINPVNGSDFTEYPIAENVSQLRVERIMGGNGSRVLVDITLTLMPPGGAPVSLNTRVGVSSGL